MEDKGEECHQSFKGKGDPDKFGYQRHVLIHLIMEEKPGLFGSSNSKAATKSNSPFA